MKRIVLKFGLISGAILAGIMILTMPFFPDYIDMDSGMVVGITSMVLAFLLVFFGIRSYRENVGGGYISFGRGFSVGILIMLISCLIYVVTWEIVYFNFYPDFMTQYGHYLMEKARASGASPAELTKQAEQVKYFEELYKNPLYVAAFTFVEPLPVGLPMTLLSAAILRKRRKEASA